MGRQFNPLHPHVEGIRCFESKHKWISCKYCRIRIHNLLMSIYHVLILSGAKWATTRHHCNFLLGQNGLGVAHFAPQEIQNNFYIHFLFRTTYVYNMLCTIIVLSEIHKTIIPLLAVWLNCKNLSIIIHAFLIYQPCPKQKTWRVWVMFSVRHNMMELWWWDGVAESKHSII